MKTSFLTKAAAIISCDGPHTSDIENGIEGVKFPNEEDFSGNHGLNGSD